MNTPITQLTAVLPVRSRCIFLPARLKICIYAKKPKLASMPEVMGARVDVQTVLNVICYAGRLEDIPSVATSLMLINRMYITVLHSLNHH